MPICPDCGVLLPESTTHCPLCRKSLKDQEQQEQTEVERAYPEKALDPEHFVQLSDRQKLKMFLEVFGVCALLACLTLLAVELLVEHRIGWSLYPVVSIVYLYILLGVPLAAKKYPWVVGCILAIATALFVLSLDLMDPTRTWYFTVGLPIVLIVELSTICCIAIIAKMKRRGVNAIAVALLGATAICVGIELVMDIHTAGDIRLQWSSVVSVTCLPIAGMLLYLHHRIINRVSLKKLFHL